MDSANERMGCGALELGFHYPMRFYLCLATWFARDGITRNDAADRMLTRTDSLLRGKVDES
jgi:hypothetical protein